MAKKAVQSDQEVENWRTLLEQHWLHCRHLEYERAGFASITAAIVGGVLAFIAGDGIEEVYPIYFLIALTIVGLLLTIRWTYAFEEHRKRVNVILKELKLNGERKFKLNGEETNLTMKISREGFFKVFNTKTLFPSFYVILLIGLILFLLKSSNLL